MVIVVLSGMSNYENQLYDQILAKLTEPDMSQQEVALSLLHGTHSLLKPRQDFFQNSHYSNIRESLFRSSDIQLVDAKGNCGSYTHVLGRLLQRAGFDIRIAQMKCNDVWACHILLEAKVDGRFVTLDALYDLYFTRSDGKLASYSEVGENWDEYRSQVPEDYLAWYAYEDVRYTNWDKVPYIMPALKSVLGIFLDDINTLSIRSWVLNVYQVYLNIFIFVYLLLMLLSAYVLYNRRKKS
jgi:hypothetical protein